MIRVTCALIGCLVVLAASYASADDSSAALDAGGLVLTHSADIRMAAEDLYVSPKEVRVRFTFANDSRKDIDTIVAFPLPDIDNYKFWGEAVGTVTGDPVNFVGFEVKEDGRKIPFQVEQHAIFSGRDVTDIVKSAGAPVNVVVDGGTKAMESLPKRALDALSRAGLVERDGNDIIAKWTTRTKFFWQQHFPAGKTVALDERYQPVTGQSFFSDEELKDGKSEDAQYWQNTFCLDGPTRSSIAGKLSAAKKTNSENMGGLLNAFTTDYVLVTGNNWKGPIGHFHLTVDKLTKENVLSMCWDGALKKASANTFEAERENFAPARDIRLLVLTSAPPP